MIGIKLDNDQEYLDLDKDTVIEIELNNPILGNVDKLSPGSSSLPFSLPGGEVSPKNSVKLNNPDVVETSDEYQPQQATVEFNRNVFKKGQIKVDGIDDNTIDAYLLFGLSTLKDDIKTKKLSDLMDTEIVIESGDHIRKALVFINDLDENITVTVNGKDYKKTTDSTIVDQINAYAATVASGTVVARAELNGIYPVNAAGYFGFIVTMGTYIGSDFTPSTDPLVELSVIFKVDEEQIFRYHTDWDLSGFAESFSEAILPYLNDVNYDSRIVFPSVGNIDGIEGVSADMPYLGIIADTLNQAQDSNFIGTNSSGNFITTPPLPIRYVREFFQFQPFLRVKYIFQLIEEYLGVEFEGDFVPATEQMILDNSTILSITQDFISWGYSRESTKWIFPRRTFNLKELIPDVTVIDFIKAFASRYNLAVYQNELNGKIVMQYKENISKSHPYENIDQIAGRKGKIVKSKITGYSLSVKGEDSDLFSKDDTVVVGDSQEEIPITLSSYRTYFTYGGTGLLGAPISNRKRGTKFGLRIFWLWDNPGSTSTVPTAVVDPAFDGNVVNPETTQVLHQKYFKYWMLFYKNKQTIPLFVNWSFNDLRRFDWTKKRMFNRSLYLVESIKIQIGKSLFKVTEASLRTQR